jgi:hypothetical protein
MLSKSWWYYTVEREEAPGTPYLGHTRHTAMLRRTDVE